MLPVAAKSIVFPMHVWIFGNHIKSAKLMFATWLGHVHVLAGIPKINMDIFQISRGRKVKISSNNN